MRSTSPPITLSSKTLSLVDVLNAGEQDLFQKDGKQQFVINGKEGMIPLICRIRMSRVWRKANGRITAPHRSVWQRVTIQRL